MVKKLFKHEISAFMRVWLPMQIILLSVAVFNRIIQFFKADTVVYDIVYRSSVFTYAVAIIAAIGFAVFFGVVRFYKNLFTGEGYLSFTLPVTVPWHIKVKLFTSVLFQVMTVIVIVISLCIVSAGEMLFEVIKSIGYLLDLVAKYGYAVHAVFYVIEGIAVILVAMLCMMLLYYACIAVGQMFNKNRILAAIGVYYGYYTVTQIIGTVLVIMFTFFVETELFKSIAVFFENHTAAGIHIVLCGVLVLAVVLGFVYYVVTKSIITKKLNLE